MLSPESKPHGCECLNVMYTIAGVRSIRQQKYENANPSASHDTVAIPHPGAGNVRLFYIMRTIVWFFLRNLVFYTPDGSKTIALSSLVSE